MIYGHTGEELYYLTRVWPEMMKARFLVYLATHCAHDDQKDQNPFCTIIQQFVDQLTQTLKKNETTSVDFGMPVIEKLEEQMHSLKDMLREKKIKIKLNSAEGQGERELVNALHDFNSRMERKEYSEKEMKKILEDLSQRFVTWTQG